MKTLLFPLIITMVITFAYGFFIHALGFADLMLLMFAVLTSIAANIMARYPLKKYPAIPVLKHR